MGNTNTNTNTNAPKGSTANTPATNAPTGSTPAPAGLPVPTPAQAAAAAQAAAQANTGTAKGKGTAPALPPVSTVPAHVQAMLNNKHLHPKPQSGQRLGKPYCRFGLTLLAVNPTPAQANAMWACPCCKSVRKGYIAPANSRTLVPGALYYAPHSHKQHGQACTVPHYKLAPPNGSTPAQWVPVGGQPTAAQRKQAARKAKAAAQAQAAQAAAQAAAQVAAPVAPAPANTPAPAKGPKGKGTAKGTAKGTPAKGTPAK